MADVRLEVGGMKFDEELPPPTESLWPAFVLLAVVVGAVVMVLWGAA